jgi:polyphosphate kinase
MKKKQRYRYADREASWLAFNARVLQEAEDATVPVGARLDFLAIFSSNLDEFFRVRVASLRSLLRLGRKSVDKLDVQPARQLAGIHRIVNEQQARFGEIFRHGILPELARRGIHLIDETAVTEAQAAHLRREFETLIRPLLSPVLLDGDAAPFLANRALYLVVELTPADGPSIAPEQPRYALVEVPSPPLPRFVTLPPHGDRRDVMFLDDVIRLELPALFPDWRVGAACAVKLTRDAELYLDDEFSGDLVAAIRKSLAKRETGLPSRFLYDLHAPYGMVTFLQQRFGLEDEDMIPGGRYHNLHDLHDFPRFGLEDLSCAPMPPLPHPSLAAAPSMLDAVAEKDHLLHFPYQSYEPVLRFLDEAADDPAVEEIWITLYRVAPGSAVVRALRRAAEQGKKVTAFVEVKARFDEESNLEFGEQLESSGVRTIYSMPGLKVHAKLALVLRRSGRKRLALAYLATGNFNERTARIYADHALLTADRRITRDVREVFAFLAGEKKRPDCKQLLVAPFDLRKRLYRMIDAEAEAAAAGRPSGIVVKLNSLEDRKIIRRVYDAAAAGVPVDLIVRGVCCLVPARRGGIRVRSIVDRWLEHARIFFFYQNGDEACFLASADWMNRNLSRRVEVAFPILDPALKAELRENLGLQLADNVKARRIDARQTNPYIRSGGAPVRAQLDFYRLLAQRSRAIRDVAAWPATPPAAVTVPPEDDHGQE